MSKWKPLIEIYPAHNEPSMAFFDEEMDKKAQGVQVNNTKTNQSVKEESLRLHKSEKLVEIKINFINESLGENEPTYLADLHRRVNEYYAGVGLRSRNLIYSMTGSDLDDDEWIFFVADYFARVCWAFSAQNKQDYLIAYYVGFTSRKAGLMNEADATALLSEYRSRSLIDDGLYFFQIFSDTAIASGANQQSGAVDDILDYWCDGLVVRRQNDVDPRITIKFCISADGDRGIYNPIKFSLFNGIKLIEHIETLNLVLGLALTKMIIEKRKKSMFKIIDRLMGGYVKRPRSFNDVRFTKDIVAQVVMEVLAE
jgi:hypothetical protein